MSFISSYNRSRDGEFRAALATAFMNYAHSVYVENGATPKHAERLILALRVIGDSDGVAARFALTIAAHNNIEAIAPPSAVPDSALTIAVTAQWNALSDVQ